MSDGLSKRLRDAAYRAKREYPEVFRVSEEIAYEAADRIEELEAALRDVLFNDEIGPLGPRGMVSHMNARAALAGEGKDD